MNSRRVLLQYIASFTVVAVLPLILFLTIMLNKDIKADQEKAMSSYQAYTQIISDNFISELSQLHKLKSTLLFEKAFYRHYLSSYGGAYIYIEKHLATAKSQNPLFEHLFFYSDETKLMYGNNIYSFKNYLKYNDIEDEESIELLSSALKNPDSKWIGFNQSVKEPFFCYTLPFEENYSDRSISSCLILNIKKDYIDNLCSSIIINDDNFVLIEVDSMPIYFSNPNVSIDSLQKSDYLTFTATDNLNGKITVTCFISKESIQSASERSIRLYTIIGLLSLFICIILIFLSVLLNYLPIKRFDQVLHSFSNSFDSSSSYFDNASKTLSTLASQNQKYVKANYDISRNSLLIKLISSDFQDKNISKLIKTYRDFNIDLNYQFFNCFVLQFDELPSNNNFDSTFLNAAINTDSRLYHVVDDANQSIIFILCSNHLTYALIDQIITLIISQNIHLMFFPGLVGVGSVVHKQTEIPQTCSEALEALQYCEQHNSNILYYKDIKKQNTSLLSILVRKVDSLYDSITAMDIITAESEYATLKNYMLQITDHHLLQKICFSVLFRCISACHTLDIDDNDINETINILSDSHRDSNTYFLQAIFSIIEKMLINIKELDSTKANSADQISTMTISNILEYIELHYLDKDFSIKQLAANNDMTVSNLSHYFKNNTGETLSNYINNLKIKTVKKMLTETDYTISYIANFVGYYHPSNFIKNFKKCEGVTPNKYRTSHKKST